MIMLNIGGLSFDQVNLTETEVYRLDAVNNMFTMIFVAEMIIKLLGLGFKEYMRDSYNKFDAVLVIFSLFELTLEVAGRKVLASGAFTVMRGIRLLRVLKLARTWTAFRHLLRWLASTVK